MIPDVGPKTRWVVDVGGDEGHSFLFKKYESKFLWIRSREGKILPYGNMDSGSHKCFVKCDFLKVNHCVLMLFQPQGRFEDHSAMISAVEKWIGNTTQLTITNVENFCNNQFWDVLNIENKGAEENTFPFGARWAVCCESEDQKNRFIQDAKQMFKKRRKDFCLMDHSEVREYSVKKEENMTMMAKLMTDRINGIYVTFIHSDSRFGDQVALQRKAQEWFPNATFVSQGETSTFLEKLAVSSDV